MECNNYIYLKTLSARFCNSRLEFNDPSVCTTERSDRSYPQLHDLFFAKLSTHEGRYQLAASGYWADFCKRYHANRFLTQQGIFFSHDCASRLAEKKLINKNKVNLYINNCSLILRNLKILNN